METATPSQLRLIVSTADVTHRRSLENPSKIPQRWQISPKFNDKSKIWDWKTFQKWKESLQNPEKSFKNHLKMPNFIKNEWKFQTSDSKTFSFIQKWKESVRNPEKSLRILQRSFENPSKIPQKRQISLKNSIKIPNLRFEIYKFITKLKQSLKNPEKSFRILQEPPKNPS